MYSANGVVAYMVQMGVLSVELAKQAAQYILTTVVEDTVDMMDIQTTNPKTGAVEWEFHRQELTGFLDWAWLVGMMDVSVDFGGKQIWPVANLLDRVNKGRSRGIAQRCIERRKLTGENIHTGRQYYSEAAGNLLNEVCYKSTEWTIVRLESITSIKHSFATTDVTELGVTVEYNKVRPAYLINGTHVVKNSQLARMVYIQSLKCMGTLVAISPQGMLVMPATRERSVDTQGKVSTTVTGLEPTMSFMRITYVLVSNAFFVLELGPQSVKHQPMASELLDVRGSRDKGEYRETTVDEFEVIEQSPEFSRQEKLVCAALGIVVGDNVNGLTAFLGAGNARNQLLAKWYDVFCGIANTRPHDSHFRKMVRNFRRHVKRFFGLNELPDVMPAKPPAPIVLSGYNLRALFHKLAEAPARPRVIMPMLDTVITKRWAWSVTGELKDGTELPGWMIGHVEPDGWRTENFYTEFVTAGGDGI